MGSRQDEDVSVEDFLFLLFTQRPESPVLRVELLYQG